MTRVLLLVVLIPAALLAAPPASQPTAKTPQLLLATLPSDAKPESTGWDEFSSPKAQKWLRDNFAGDVLVVAPLAKAELKRVANAADPLDTAGWNISIGMKASAAVVGKATIYVTTRTKDSEAVVIASTESVARASKKWTDGESVSVKASIVSAEVSPPITWMEFAKDGSVVPRSAPHITITVEKPELLSVGKWKPAKP